MGISAGITDQPTTNRGLLPTAVRKERAQGRRLKLLGSAQPSTANVIDLVGDGYALYFGDWTNGGLTSAAATFETWIQTTYRGPQVIFQGNAAASPAAAAPLITLAGDRLTVQWGSDPTDFAAAIASADTRPVSDGRWHHIAVVFDENAVTFYKDGVASDDQNSLAATRTASGGDTSLYLGQHFGAGPTLVASFTGLLWNTRIWSTARTGGQISGTRWTPLTTAQNGLNLSMGYSAGQFVNLVGDDPYSNAFGYVNGSAPSTPPVVDLPAPTGCALSFTNGTGLVQFEPLPQVMSSSGMTVECWINIPAAEAGTRRDIMSFEGASSGSARLEYFGGQQLAFTWRPGGSDQTVRSVDTAPIADGAWHHIAVVFDHNFVRFFKDGVATADPQTVLPSTLTAGTDLLLGGGQSPAAAFVGLLADVRVWTTARTIAQISAFRYVQLIGNETGLNLLCNLSGLDPTADPSTWANVQNQVPGSGTHTRLQQVTVVAVDAPNAAPVPVQVWTYPLAGISPIGPVTATGATVTIDTVDGQTSGGLLRCVDPQTGSEVWEYDVRARSGIAGAVIPPSVSVFSGTVYAGAQTASGSPLAQIHAVDAQTGQAVWSQPAALPGVSDILTRPVLAGGQLIVGVTEVTTDETDAALAWGDPATGQLAVNYRFAINPLTGDGTYSTFMSVPVSDGAAVYVATVAEPTDPTHPETTVQVTAISLTSSPAAALWQVQLATWPSAEMVLGAGLLFVCIDGSVSALRIADGKVIWTTPLSKSSINARPVLVGNTLYVGSTDGLLYALDAVAGGQLWKVDTQSAITTDLINDNGMLYFANQGDGGELPPAFLAVDTLSAGEDVLLYPVPNADTILFTEGGTANGNAYFYSASTLYAVNMASVSHEFTVNSKLIVENYNTATITRADGEPTGSDTSYRVSIAVRDADGLARTNQPVKLTATDTVSITNQGQTLAIGPSNPVWVQTDQSGELTIAVSAYDSAGAPQVTCPALLLWSTFMAPGEAVVVYPDHETVTNLSGVQGSRTGAGRASGDKAPATANAATALYLDTATGYDGQPLIAAQFNTPSSLNHIASAISNTIGTRNGDTVGTTRLAGHRHNRYVARTAAGTHAVRNVLYSSDATISTARVYSPGADPTFTIDVSTAAAAYSTGYDTTSPAGNARVKASRSVFHSIDDFVDHVVHGAETVLKTAWQYVEGKVQTYIQTAESVYQLTINSLEDAVKAVTGFLKSVVNDVRRAVEWLSSLFNWGNILANHRYLKAQLSNPTASDPSQLGILDTVANTLSTEVNGQTTYISGLLSSLVGSGSTSVMNSSTAMAGQTVGSNQSNGNSDPNTVYNMQGQNNSNQCTWLQQKTNENSGGASIGNSAAADAFDSTTIENLITDYLAALAKELEGDFAGLPDELEAHLKAALDSFKDPKTLLSAGLDNLIAIFVDIAEDFIEFGVQFAAATVTLLGQLLAQIIEWLNQPITIPFVSELYQLIAKEPLTLLDLLCLLAAVPATILLDVITGSPTVPATTTASIAGISDGDKAGLIVMGAAALVLGQIGDLLDIATLDFRVDLPDGTRPPTDGALQFLSYLALGCDFVSWGLYAGASLIIDRAEENKDQPWGPYDWTFQCLLLLPQMLNFGSLFTTIGPGRNPGQVQCYRDTVFAVITIVISAVFADRDPSGYRDTPKARGLALAANLFGAVQGLSEVLFLLLDPWSWAVVQALIKYGLFTVGNVLTFTGEVLSVVSE